MVELSDKQKIQEEEYQFPYHYIPQIDSHGRFTPTQSMVWGYEYLAYLRYVIARLSEIEFDTLLDVGCGDGRLLHEIHRSGLRKTLTGLDYSPQAIRLAQAMNPSITFLAGDVTSADIVNQRFDVATLVDTLEHIDPQIIDEFVSGVSDRLEVGGALIVTVPSINTPTEAKHYQHFSAESLTNMLSTHFTAERLDFINQTNKKIWLIERLFGNRLFILNNKAIADFLYRHYESHFLNATPQNGKRIFGIFRKCG